MRYIARSLWHPSQKIRKLRCEGGAIELNMTVALTVELTRWILSFGRDAEIISPDSLRTSVWEEIKEMSAVYLPDG